MDEDQYLTPDDLLMADQPPPVAAPAPARPGGWQMALMAAIPAIAAGIAMKRGAALPAMAGLATGWNRERLYQDEQARIADEQRRRDELVQVQQARVRQQFVSDFLRSLESARTPEEYDAKVMQGAAMAPSVGIDSRRFLGMYRGMFPKSKHQDYLRKLWGDQIDAIDMKPYLQTPERTQTLLGSILKGPGGEQKTFRDAWVAADRPLTAVGEPLLPLPDDVSGITIDDVIKKMPAGVQARALDWMQQHPGQKPPPMILNQWESDDKRENKAAITINMPGAATSAVPTGVVGEAALEGVSEAEKALVRKIADYKIPLPGGMALRSEKWQRILELVAAFDPSFDASQYEQRRRLRVDFTVGKGGQNIRSLNTAVGHLGTLEEKARALENSSYDLWNKIKNFGYSRIGDPRVVDFNVAANAVAGELATLFKNTSGTDQEIKAWRDQVEASQSPEQLRSAVETAVELLGSRLSVLTSQYETGMGKPKDFIVLQPKARRILKRFGVDPSVLDPVATSKDLVGGAEGQQVDAVYDLETDSFRPARRPR